MKKINRLRQIGWTLWDPIGLRNLNESWRGQPYEDEYDAYLLEASRMLKLHHSEQAAINYLFDIQSRHMGLGPDVMDPQTEMRLAEVVRALAPRQIPESLFRCLSLRPEREK